MLERNGLGTLRTERSEAYVPVDFVSTTALLCMRLMPTGVVQWGPRRASGAIACRLIFTASLPLLTLAFAADRAWAPLAPQGPPSQRLRRDRSPRGLARAVGRCLARVCSAP